MRPRKPSNARDPLLRQLFDEQDRLNVNHATLGRLSGINKERISKLRRPVDRSGKNPTLYEVRALAEALDFDFPNKLRKNGEY